jgi:Fe-S-cluster containining protein
VWDNIENRITVTDREMIKVKEKGAVGTGCTFYEVKMKGCRIYAHRPSQCRALMCWDHSVFLDVHRSPKLERGHLLLPGAAMALMAEHEKRCAYKDLEDLVTRIRGEGETPVQEIMKMLRFDFHLRPLASERLGMDPEEMDLLFGRPLTRTIRRFGLQVIQESNTYVLTPLASRPTNKLSSRPKGEIL